MEPALFALALLGSVLAVGLAIGTVQRTRGLQRRLFLLLLAVSLIPAAVVFAVSLAGGRRAAEVVDAPGLQSSLEAALDLARDALGHETDELRAWARAWAGDERAESAGEEPLLALRADEPGASRVWGAPVDAAWLRAQFGHARGRGSWRAEREGRSWLLVHEEVPGGWVLAARALPLDLAENLRAIEEGSRGVAQLRLYYGPWLRVRTWLLVSGTALLLLVASVLASRSVAGRLAAPVAALVQGTRRVAAGDLDTRVRVQATEDLGELVEAFNGMTAELQSGREQLRRSERIAAWRGIARRLAHEIKNPLTPILLSVHRLRKDPAAEPLREGLDVILEETERLRRLADDFALLARLPEPRRRSVPLAAVFDRVLSLYAPRARVERDPAVESVWLDADEGQLHQVLSNLVKNAVEWAGDEVRLSLRVAARGALAHLEIEDDGPGLPAEIAERADDIFEPDFSRRSSGTGLGLAIVRRIVEDHGGAVGARNSERGGLVVDVRWPRAEEPGGEGSAKPGETDRE